MIRLTALMENVACEAGMAAEHGLSLLVEYGGKKVLFDCGQSGLFLENARCLGFSLENLDAVVLSHSHYDHAKGFRELVNTGVTIPLLYTGGGFFEPKYSRQNGGYADRSCGFDRAFLVENHIRHVPVEDVTEICPGMWILSGFPRKTNFETIPEKFLRKTVAGFRQDDFADEVCLALEADGGIVMIVGCSHPGIVNMVTQVRTKLQKPVLGVFGGTHLSEAPEARLGRTLDLLAEAGVRTLGFCHCSGAAVEAMVDNDSRFRGCHLGSGKMIQF